MKLLERLRSSSSDRWSPRKQGKGHDKEDQPPATPNTQMPLLSSTSSGATRQQQQHVPSPLRRLSVPPPPLPSLFAPGQKSDILNRKDLQEVRIDRLSIHPLFSSSSRLNPGAHACFFIYQKTQLDSLLPAMFRGYSWDLLFS